MSKFSDSCLAVLRRRADDAVVLVALCTEIGVRGYGRQTFSAPDLIADRTPPTGTARLAHISESGTCGVAQRASGRGASQRRPCWILSLMLCDGSFQRSSSASGGSKPRAASNTRPPVDVTPATSPTTIATRTHTAATADLIFRSSMPQGYEGSDTAGCTKRDSGIPSEYTIMRACFAARSTQIALRTATTSSVRQVLHGASDAPTLTGAACR